MALTKRKKTNTMKKTRRHDDDTGSPEAQIALLTRRINELSDHLKDNPKDKGSRKGLLSMVEKRRKQINYLLDNNPQAYKQVAEEFDMKSLEDRQEQAKAEIGEDEQEE